MNLLHDLGEHILHLVQLLVADLILYGYCPHPLLYVHWLGLILLDGVALILALFLVSSFSLALFHVCVENRLLTFNSTCVFDYNYLTSYDEYIKAIISADLVSCDQPVPFLFGLSMAFWNLIYSIFCISIYIFITLKPKK